MLENRHETGVKLIEKFAWEKILATTTVWLNIATYVHCQTFCWCTKNAWTSSVPYKISVLLNLTHKLNVPVYRKTINTTSLLKSEIENWKNLGVVA